MSQRNVQITFESNQALVPFYTGGPVSVDQHGQILATCLGDTVVLSDFRNGKLMARIEGDGEAVTTLNVTPSATHLVVCSRSLSMRIYALETLESATRIIPTLTRTLKPFGTPVVAACVDESGSILATGSADGTIKVWNLEGGYVSHTFNGHSGVISAFRFFKTSKTPLNTDKSFAVESNSLFYLASGGEDGRVRIWDLGRRKPVANLEAHSSVVTALDYSARENTLISGSRDQTLTIWDARTWKSRKILPILEPIEGAGILAEGRVAYCGGESGKVRIWDLGRGREITSSNTDTSTQSSLVSILHSRDANILVCVREDFVFELRDTSHFEDSIPIDRVDHLALLRRVSGTHDEVIDLAFVAPQNGLIALATNTESIKLVNAHRAQGSSTEHGDHESFGTEVGILEGHEDIILCLDVDPSGCWLATGAKDNTARLWKYDMETKNFSCTTVFTGHAGSVGAIALTREHSQPGFSNSDFITGAPRYLLTGSQDKTIKRWDIKLHEGQHEVFNQSRATYTRKAHDKDINALAMAADSTSFASASQDRLVKIWSTEDGEVKGVLRGHKRGVWSVSFAPKGTTAISGDLGPETSKRGVVLTGSGDRTVKIWSLSSYECLRSFEGHVNSILKVVWIPPADATNGDTTFKRPHLVASAGADGLVKVWDTQSSDCLCTLDNHTERVWALTFEPFSQCLVSGGGDGVVTFWNDTTETTMATAAAKSTALVEQEQLLMNHVHRGNYREAIVLALQLNHPARLLSIFSDVMKTVPPETGSLCGVKAVDDVISGLNDDQLFTLMLRLRDWNANARTASVAQRILWVIFKIFPASKLVKIKKDGKSLGEVLEGLEAYTERHFMRTEELLEESYLVDFIVRSMEESGFMGSEDILNNGVLGHKEVVM